MLKLQGFAWRGAAKHMTEWLDVVDKNGAPTGQQVVHKHQMIGKAYKLF